MRIIPENALRAIGVVPILFFLSSACAHVRAGTAADLLWICNIVNLLLGAGLLFRVGLLLRMSAILLVGGSLFWVLEAGLTGDLAVVSILTHVASACVAVVGSVSAGAWEKKNGSTFLYCVLLYVLLQVLCRFTTPPELNVNTAFAPYHPWAGLIPNFFIYNTVNLLALALYGWLIEKALMAFSGRFLSAG